ncbi:hypothetical protein ABCS02_15760 [Microbacterium sp. X-17]|uniref:hypothetical protein n=1 Tax=Microbacterium sp. X-17 TaxID=3144404 RepID=UPI0031F4FF28
MPSRVNTAFWLYIACAAVSLVMMIVAIATAGAAVSQVQQSGKLSAGDTSAAVGVLVTTSVVVGVLYIVAYVLFAVFMRRGANWARIVLLIVTALSLTGALGLFGVGALRLVLGVVATILVFIPPASEYFRSGRAARP